VGLNGVFLSRIDLRRTAVTAGSILSMGSHTIFPRSIIYIDFDQFTLKQVEMLRQYHEIAVGEPPLWD
jgi:hypothetical protein